MRSWLLLLWYLLPGCFLISEGLPKGRSGPEADDLARQVMQAVADDAWKKTGYVEWTFAGENRHAWDRERDLIRVAWDDVVVVRALWDDRGVVTEGGRVVEDPDDRRDYLDEAYAKWVNDAFWLHPFEKMFDKGVVRSVVEADGRPALLITFTTGGLTPGDSFLFHLDANTRPTRWQMWTSNVPVGGAGATWDGWQQLDSGAWVSTTHETRVFTLKLSDVRGTASWQDLHDTDPFAAVAK